MNSTPIRAGLALLAALTLAGCGAQRSYESQATAESCEYPDTLTCEEFAGELFNCVCANEDDLRRMFEVLSDR